MNPKRDEQVMKLLKVSSLTYLIAKTNMGELSISLRFGEPNYFLSLDSVPLEKEKNTELMALLYPQPIPSVRVIQVASVTETPKPSPKPKGRPKGSKNK